MNFITKASKVYRGIGLALVAVLLVGVAAVALADHDSFGGVPQTSVEICHAEGNGGYTPISPNVSGAGGNLSLAGHENDNGVHAADIIPPFHYELTTGGGPNATTTIESYSGKNWTAPNIEIWNGGLCNGGTPPPPALGSITIDKVVTGAGANEDLDFSFSVTGTTTDAISLSDNDSPVVISNLLAGPFTLSENSIPTDWNLTSIACTGETSVETSPASITLAAGENVTCTVTNNYTAPDPGSGSLTILKDTDDESGDQTAFGFTLDDVAFPDDGTLFGNNADYETFSDLSVGNHTVAEVDLPDWSFGSVTCSNLGDPEWNAYDPGDANVVVTIADGDNITCTFTNTKDLIDDTTITINKVTSVESQQTFGFFLDDSAVASATLAGGQSSGAIVVSAGSHNIVEGSVEGWDLTGATCLNEAQQVVGGQDGAPYYLTLVEGDDITCTFTNRAIETNACNVTIVSDTTNTVNELADANAFGLTFIHGAWTAAISGATWIWGSDPVVDPTIETTQTFKKTFVWNGPITNAVLDVASDNSYSVVLNGNLIGGDPAGDNFSAVDSYDPSASIVTGTNTLEITVTNLAVVGSTANENPAGLLYKLSVDGNTDVDCHTPPQTPGGDDDDDTSGDDDDDDDTGGGGGSSSRRRGSSSSSDGEVLGEQTSILPIGAPSTGFGGLKMCLF